MLDAGVGYVSRWVMQTEWDAAGGSPGMNLRMPADTSAALREVLFQPGRLFLPSAGASGRLDGKPCDCLSDMVKKISVV